MNKQDREALETAILQFPAEFALRAFPGDTFRVSRFASYVSNGVPMIYTEIKRGNNWQEFCKGTVSELKSQIVDR